MISKIQKCRSCKKKNLRKLFSLGNIPLSGIFPKKNEKVDTGNLTLVICKNCKLVQLDRNFSLKKMYGENYGYRTGLNKSMVNHMKQKSNFLKKYIANKNKKNVILDIGSNDGTFLSFFKEKNFIRYGIDPTIKKFKKFYEKNILKVEDFFTHKSFIKKSKKKADLITCMSMLYDLQNPEKFIQDIYLSLNENGVWHTEQSYLKTMLKKNSYDTICHEHLEYYTLTSLKYLFDKVGFKIIDINLNEINGGSIAITLAKRNSKHKEITAKINKILKNEKKEQLDKSKTFIKFFNKINVEKKKLINFLKKLRKANNLVLGYGASTKGNILLNYCRINNSLVKHIAEVNTFKFGKQTPGTRIDIISEKKAKKMKPHYFLVFPWHFKDFILAKEKNFIKKENTKFIFPLPKLTVV